MMRRERVGLCWRKTVLILILAPFLAACGKPSPPAVKHKFRPLGDEARIIEWLWLSKTGAVVMLREKCGVHQKYGKAKVFAYSEGKPSATTEKQGCWHREGELSRMGDLVVYESDGVAIGKLIVSVKVGESFNPMHFFLPLDNDPRREKPKIVAVANHVTIEEKWIYDNPIGLTLQQCPIEPDWQLARHIPAGSRDDFERCWRRTERGIEIKEIDYSQNPLKLSKESKFFDQNLFFQADSLHTKPTKFTW